MIKTIVKLVKKAIQNPKAAVLYTITVIIWLNSPAKYATALAGAILCEGKAFLAGKTAQRYAFAFAGLVFASSISVGANFLFKVGVMAAGFYLAYKKDHDLLGNLIPNESDDLE